MNDPVNGGTTDGIERSRLPGCRSLVVMAMMVGLIVLLASILWQRIRQVDPVRRCANAYNSSHTPIDTTLVDRINVRTPDGTARTTCGELRQGGVVDRLPRQEPTRPFDNR